MRATLLVFIGLALTVPVSRAGTEGDLLRFRNGDALHGTVTTVDPVSGLNWLYAGAAQPIVFDLTNVVELLLAPRPPRTSRVLHRFSVELTNGDRLAGDVEALNEASLTLDTWYAGRLSIQRAALKRLVCRAMLPDVIYTGPTGLEDWKVVGGQGAWTFKQGKFQTKPGLSGTIGRDVELPELANLEFDVAWRGQSYWTVSLYCADVRNPQATGSYQLVHGGNSFQLQRIAAGNSRSLSGGNERPEQKPRSQAHVTIRVNKSQKSFWLYIDQKLVKQWTDSEEFAGKGTGLVFGSHGQGELRLANILVTKWDGKLDADSTPATGPAEDLLRLTNGDKVSGALRTINNGETQLALSYAEVKVPLERIASIEFAAQKAEKARRQDAAVRAAFPDGTRFTLTLEKMDGQALTGTTETCGRVTIPLDTFTRVQFHIYDKPVPLDNDDEWGGTTTND